ncbi:Trans-resveratrol di-O-methyltransferase [Hibiscus syriacus]|uniref:Trans-resveratrol di-O-methyltransferase n=1 Tax=Hibiscus syriacus TaxID=106335 RepID=A0A6A2YJY9_HIBSY|nr:Trans-resveratrol di-O-methyltransferase [Hibiscus syriacus]
MNLMKGDEIDLDELLQAQPHVCNYTFRYISSMSLKCAVELQIPDIIHNRGGGQPITISDLAFALGIHPSKLQYLDRLMRILIHSGFFAESETDDRQKTYALTPVSRLLRKDNPMSSRPFILAMLDPVFLKPWEYLSGWLQNDDHPSEFIAAHGETMWDYAGHEPRLNRFFNDAMTSDGLVAASAVLSKYEGVFEGMKSVVGREP